MQTLVMKFGGASVATPEHFSLIANIILQKKTENQRIVIVVSAMGDTTDELIELAKKVHPNPPRREYDMLVTVGERISIALLAMALSRQGQDAVSFTGSQSGIITSTDHTEARIINVKPHRILKSLDTGKVVIVAGFQGVSTAGEITTLGRGGSDTSAVALGIALNADRVEFFKDVRGIYESDPKKNPEAKIMSKLTYDQALDIVGRDPGVLHNRCLELAKLNYLPLVVKSFVEEAKVEGTTISSDGSGIRPSVPIYEDEIVNQIL
jgi:aspartate kinase